MRNSFGARQTLRVGDREYEIFRLDALERAGLSVARLPYSLRILLEGLLRAEDGAIVTVDDVEALAGWRPDASPDKEVAFTPGRVLLQDFTGVPALVDLAAMRDSMAALGGDPSRINPLQPVELVVDHSVQVDAFGAAAAFHINEERDYERNGERYAFLKWGQQTFENFRVVPPNTGICHQVNLEYLARVVFGLAEDGVPRSELGLPQAYPDTLVGTDSHTPMVNGLGVLGWGVGGIEAEAAMLGQPISMLIPDVIGFRLAGELPEGATATDLVLTVAEMLRKKGVVGKFVEFYGPGVSSLALADRATIGNMSPEYGATCAIFPVDRVTLEYMRFTGRSDERVALVEAYMKQQGLFHSTDSPEPEYTDTLALDLNTIEPSVAGPKRPQDRIRLSEAKRAFQAALPSLLPEQPAQTQKEAAVPETDNAPAVGVWGEDEPEDATELEGTEHDARRLQHGSVVIAAITSCTNTSNPSVMVAAGLLAKNAVERGLARKPWVKTSLAPGSKVVTDYYERAGLTRYLDELGFQTVGYGCTTCIGNSGPLPPEISEIVADEGLVVASVLSGNRNFEGRIHSEVRANYLMSPPLVVAFALAGRIDIDLYNEPLGRDAEGRSVFLKDIWPTQAEVEQTIRRAIDSSMYRKTYAEVFAGDERWNGLDVPAGARYAWDAGSTYVRQPPFFDGLQRRAPVQVSDIRGARVLALLGDSITTDHISPAGSIKRDSPAGRYLVDNGVEPRDFNSYGSRRGNHEVMMRGTFANVRLRNRLAPGTEGGFAPYLPGDEVLSMYNAAMRYKADDTPLLILAGKEYGSGSSRDWAAKGVQLLGVAAVIAESYERIHRSNLIGMAVLPLQFAPGDSVESLGLTGREVFDIEGLSERLAAGLAADREIIVRAWQQAEAAGQERRVPRRESGVVEFPAIVRIDTPQELEYYRNGGILQYVLRQLLNGKPRAEATSAAIAATAQSERGAVSDPQAADEGSIDSFPASDPPTY